MNTIKFLLLLIIVLFSTNISAQDYNTGVGIRAGYPIALSVKQFTSEETAFEIYVGQRGYAYYSTSTTISAALQIHKPLEFGDFDKLKYYYGVGASAILGRGGLGSFFGIQGYFGIDFTLDDFPVSLTADYVPTLHLGGGIFNTFGWDYGGLGIRYIIK